MRWCGVFGIAEGTAHVALSRMVDRGKFGATDGVYSSRARFGPANSDQE